MKRVPTEARVYVRLDMGAVESQDALALAVHVGMGSQHGIGLLEAAGILLDKFGQVAAAQFFLALKDKHQIDRRFAIDRHQGFDRVQD